MSGDHNLTVASVKQLEKNVPQPMSVTEMVEILGWGEPDGEA